MKTTLIALGAGAGFLLMAGSALAGPCSANIEALSKQLQATDAGMGPTANAGGTAGTANPVSPSGEPQATTPATGTMNEASQNKATSAQDVQNQNTGQNTMADQAAGGSVGNQTAAASLERAKMFDQAGDEAACLDEVTKGQKALTQP